MLCAGGKEGGRLCVARAPWQKEGGLCEGAQSEVTSYAQSFPEGGDMKRLN